jgi:hypothetical protein
VHYSLVCIHALAVSTVVWCMWVMQSSAHTCFVLLTLPLMQEWFSTSILLFASELPSAPASSPSVHVASVGIPAMPETSVQALMQLAQEFEELANTCLLVLHLEVSCWMRYVAILSPYLALCTSSQETSQIFGCSSYTYYWVTWWDTSQMCFCLT